MRICFYGNTTSHFARFISSKIHGGVQNTGALSQVLFIITFQEWSRGREEESWCRGVWSPCFGSPKKTIRYNRSLDGGTQHRTTEDSVSSMSSVRLTRTDGIKSSEAREGGVANLNFPSRQPPRGRFFAFAGINGHVTAGLLAIHARCRHYANHRSGRLTDISSSPAASGRARGSIEKGGK